MSAIIVLITVVGCSVAPEFEMITTQRRLYLVIRTQAGL